MVNATAAEIAAVQARKKHPYCLATINGHKVYGTRVRIRHGFGLPTEGGGGMVATCDLELVTRPDWLAFRQRVVVSLGYADRANLSNTVFRVRFTGFVEDDGASAWPNRRTVRAVGFLRYAEDSPAADVTYASEPGGDNTRDIITAILEDAGITDVDVRGDDTTLGTVEDVVLGARQPYLGLIQRIDHAHLDVTFDWLPSGKVRRITITGLPAESAAWPYTYPGEVLEIENPETIRDVRNRVEVIGLDECSATRRADSPYVRSGYDRICPVDNDLIESDAEAAEVAAIWMPSVNRITRRVRIRVPGNPLLWTSDTINLDAPNLPVPVDNENLWLGEIDEEYSQRGYWMWLTLYGGKGESGYPVYTPYADFSYKIVVENFDFGGGNATYYIVYCDGTASSSPDGSALSYSWSNDQTAAVSSETTYRFVLTEAQLDAPCIVSLTVTNSSSESDTWTEALPAHDSGDERVEIRIMYLALETDAAATSDGGQNWNTVTDNATCTPEIAGEAHSYFGVGAVLSRTDDFLATALVAAHTFAATINAIWINEVDANKVAVCLTDGSVWVTSDASLVASATWTKRYQFGLAVNWVVWAWDGVIWALMGSQVIADGTVRWNLDNGYTAKRLALSFYAHYAAGDDGAGNVQVKRNDGVEITFPVGANPARLGGLTHHISEDRLWAADDQGRFWEKGPGQTSFTLISTIGGGECYHMVRDGTNPFLIWAACDSGLYKSFDAGRSWYQERASKTLMVGYGSAPWGPVTAATLVSEDTATDPDVTAMSLWDTDHNDDPPANWRDVSYDDSGWAGAVHVATAPGQTPIAGTDSVWTSDPYLSATEANLFRHKFTLTAGVITSATLTVTADGYITGVWVNGVFIGQRIDEESWNGVRTFSVSPAILNAGGDNVLAMHVTGVTPTDSWGSWKLEIS